MAQGIRWAYNAPILTGDPLVPRSVSAMISILSGLAGYGYNVASTNWRPPREWGQQQYLDVVRAAEQAGIQLMPWMGWSTPAIEQVMGWISGSPAILGWYAFDEPLAGGATLESQRGVYAALKQYDPQKRPVFTTFTNARSEDWARAYDPGTFNIAAMDLYPYAMKPADPEEYLTYWANRLASYFIDAGKQVIPMMQGYTHPGTPSPKIMPQWEWWRASRMPLYPNSYSVYGGEVHSQAAQLARLLGWSDGNTGNDGVGVRVWICSTCGAVFQTPEGEAAHIQQVHLTEELTCPGCGSLLRVHKAAVPPLPPPPPPGVRLWICSTCGQIFQTPEEEAAHIQEVHLAPETLKCVICGYNLNIRLKTVQRVEIISSPVIDQLLADIAGMDTKIAELKAKINNVRTEIARYQEILGL